MVCEENVDFFRDPRKGWRRRAEPELIFKQIISFNAIFNLVNLMMISFLHPR